MSTVTRHARLAHPPDAVLAYVAHVPNLPAWTTFFLAVGPARGDAFAVESLVGPLVIWTEVTEVAEIDGAGRCVIRTLNAEQPEQAVVEVRPGPGGSQVSFTVMLPVDDPGPVALARAAETVDRELARLGERLGGQVDTAAAGPA